MTLRKLMLAAASAAVVAMAAPGLPAVAQTAPTPPDAMAFAREPAMSSVTLSPDGRHMAAIISPDGQRRALAIWRTDRMDQEPYIVGTDERSELLQVTFVKNDRMFVTTQQLSNYNPFSGSVEQTYRYRTQVVDLQGNPIRLSRYEGLDQRQSDYVGVGTIISPLPNHPTDILVQDPIRGDIYRMNLQNGSLSRVERGSDRYGSYQADMQGNVRARMELVLEGGNAHLVQHIRHPDTNQWQEHFRWTALEREPVEIVGFTTDPNVILVSATRGQDRAAIYEYSIRDRAFGEAAFAHPLFPATGVVRSTAERDYGEILGFRYSGERSRTYWVDPALEQANEVLRRAMGIQDTPVTWVGIDDGVRRRFEVGDGAELTISDWSDDRTMLIVEKSGPRTPPEYYLVQDGRARLLGRAYPEIDPNAIGETRLIQYAARDGLMIPAFITTPPAHIYGPGPYPTIVTPHGGPWARDDLTWDQTGWTQYFAARGYAVLQPQYRGSDGWGQRLWKAGDREWGGRMQDDKDDGVRYLIEQGIADPDRVAMHGYSYGGYAAMVAAVRPNGLYQCAIAGAGPSSLDLIRRRVFSSRVGREFQGVTLQGMDPINHVNEVSIPVFLYTGDRDTRVIPAESERFAAALRNAGKDVTIRILPDMEHTLNTWTPANFQAMLTSVEEYLRTSCGPGGL